jgi:hypothetical protein
MGGSMNNIDPVITNSRGIVLTDNVNLSWLRLVTPKFHPNYIKFVINIKTNKVCVGLDVHKDAQVILSDSDEPLFGGNIYFNDGSIIYESTLNVSKNIKSGWFKTHPGNPRIITDPKLIESINNVLLTWVDLSE